MRPHHRKNNAIPPAGNRTASEGARFWTSVMTDLRNRGMRDILIACCDGLAGFDAICAAVPPTTVQRCVVVHLVRNALRPVALLRVGHSVSPQR